jgi:amino acid adenylation domain-containing protein
LAFYLLGQVAQCYILMSIVQESVDLEEDRRALLTKYLDHNCEAFLSELRQESKSIFLLESFSSIRPMLDSHIAGSTDLNASYMRIQRTPDVALTSLNRPPNALSILHGDTKAHYDNMPQTNHLTELVMHKFSDYDERIALTYLNESISYSQLLRYVDQTVCTLLEKGIQPGDVVGVFMKHSILLVVTLLSVLKVGAAYIPLDVDYPVHRLKHIAEDSKLKVVITVKDLIGAIEKYVPSVLVVSNNLDDKQRSEKPHLKGSLAYIIYTSGSSGKPKGVRVLHDAVVNFLLSMQNRVACTRDDVFLMHTTISFDIAILEIFLPLMIGARVVIAPRELLYEGSQLLNYIAVQGVSVLQATPSFWQMLIEYGWKGSRGLTAISGGELLPLALAKKLIGISKNLWNVYGPTEATVWASVYLVEQVPTAMFIPIGKPLDNVSLYIVDGDDCVVTRGQPGEICIGGAGLADGYVNRPELDREKFIDLTLHGASVPVYKTGDVGRIDHENLIFLGRNDRQTKLHGYRIELAEIENVLLLHSRITTAAVTKTKTQDGLEVLKVHYTSDNRVDIPDGELRNFLRGYLPDYMLPFAYVRLDKIPLTHNHKIDYNRISTLSDVEVDVVKEADLAKIDPSDTSSILLSIWIDLFKHDRIVPHSNFFELGGTSLLALRLIARIRDELQSTLSVATLYQYPTVSALVDVVNSNRGGDGVSCEPCQAST